MLLALELRRRASALAYDDSTPADVVVTSGNTLTIDAITNPIFTLS